MTTEAIVGVRGAVPYVFCADAGAVADWCMDVLGFHERGRWTNDDGQVSNVELTLVEAEVWLDGPVPDWDERLSGLGSWIGLMVDDVDAVYEQVRSRVAELDPPVDRAFGTRHLTDCSRSGGSRVGFRPAALTRFVDAT